MLGGDYYLGMDERVVRQNGWEGVEGVGLLWVCLILHAKSDSNKLIN